MTENTIKSIDVTTLKNGIDSKKNIIILDVRMPQEYKEGYINTSINVPLDTLTNNDVEKIVKNHPNKTPLLVVLQCRSGVRSLMALSKINQDSDIYEEVEFVNLSGGILDWADKGYEIKY